MRRFPPFVRVTRWVGEAVSVLHFTCVSNHHDFFVKHFSNIFEIIFSSSRAIIFLDAREIFLVSPFRKRIVTAFLSLSIPESWRLTSFATIRSHPFEKSFLRAFAFSFCVSAANPTTRYLRGVLASDTRMSRVGFNLREKIVFRFGSFRFLIVAGL